MMFSHQVTRLQFPSDVSFGQDVTIPISNAADISVGALYLRVDWPIASPVDDSVGTRMFDYVELMYKDKVIERHYGETIELTNDLQVPQAKQQVLQDLLGKGLTSNLASYYIRLPFSINMPLCALETPPVVRFKFKQISEFSKAQWTGPVTMYLFVDYVYVTDPERDLFKTKTMDYMTHTFQRLQFYVEPNVTTVPILTEFIGEVTELFWVIQTDGTSAYDFSNDGQDQLASLTLTLNGIDVILSEVGTPLYLGSVQPLTYHTRAPDRKFYIYSFGLDPEDPQSTGQLNFNKIFRQLHTLQLTPCAFSRQVRIYARTTRPVKLEKGNLHTDNNIMEAGTKIVNYNSGNKTHYPGLYYFDTFTFTTLGTSGRRGPASTLTYANAPWSSNQFSIVDGQQYWTVPATGTYRITAAGAYGAKPGRIVSGNVQLSQGQVLKMLIGQLPTPLTSSVVDNLTVGGGGGTFVTSGSTPLIVASGGDGTGGSAASFSPYGTGVGIDGAGYFSNGAVVSATYLFLKPMAYVYGGFGNSYVGGVVSEEGGFGGGQSPKVTGISGGGGYTGSPGTGASGATCYADSTITNFKDLGAVSNTAGYVTVSLVNPVPLTYTWSWDPTRTWTITNAVSTGLGTPVWSSSLGLFLCPANYSQIVTSPDGITCSVIQTNLPILSSYNSAYGLVASTTGILLAISSDTGYVYRSTDASTWTLSLSSSINRSYSVFINNLFILKGNNNTTVYTSPDGLAWTTITPNVMFTSITYGNSKYVLTDGIDMYTSTGLVTWSPIVDSNVATSTNGWSSVLFNNQTFVALRNSSSYSPSFSTTNTSMSPRPVVMINNPITNITSLTFTGSWNGTQAKIGDTLIFSSISNFAYTVSPATYGTVTAVNSGSVTVSLVSSTITAVGSANNNITLLFTKTGTNYTVVTSSDGTNWYGQTTPSSNWGILLSGGNSFIAINYFTGVTMYSLDKGVTWALSVGNKGGTTGVYSPNLKYFLFTEGNIFYLSLDGSIIVPAVSGGTIGNPLQLVWADTLGLLVAVTGYSILISFYGNTWKLVLNLKPSGGSDITGSTVTWSRELGLLVAYFCNSNTNNSPLVYTSSDGITWSRTVLVQAFPNTNSSINPCKPCWSSQLGLFTIGKANSRDGIIWTFGSGPNLVCAIWSPSLNLFVGNDGTNSYYSTDGSSWMSSSSYAMYSIAWSPSLGLFVGVGEQSPSSSPFLIYTSSNGTSWAQVYSDVASSASAWYGNVVWSPELNVFICVYQQTTAINGTRILISSNGQTWVSPGSNIINAFNGGDLIWSPDLKIFLFTTQRNQTGMFKSLTATKTFA